MTTSRDEIKKLIKKMKQEFDEAGLEGLEQNRSRFEKVGMNTPLPDGIEVIPLHLNPTLYAEKFINHTSSKNKNILYFHGGGYSIGSPKSHRPICARLAKASSCEVLSIDYRLAPEHSYPAALEDTISSYLWLLQQTDKNIYFAGDSAGGGLMMATLLKIKIEQLPMPSGAIGISAWLDLECSSPSYELNKEIDLLASAAGLRFVGRAYARKNINQDPLISPFYAKDLSGLCPLLLQVGDAETLLDENLSFARQALADGVKVDLQVWSNMVHVWHSLYGLIPEAEQAINAIGKWINKD